MDLTLKLLCADHLGIIWGHIPLTMENHREKNMDYDMAAGVMYTGIIWGFSKRWIPIVDHPRKQSIFSFIFFSLLHFLLAHSTPPVTPAPRRSTATTAKAIMSKARRWPSQKTLSCDW